jgi:hypothetical protein
MRALLFALVNRREWHIPAHPLSLLDDGQGENPRSHVFFYRLLHPS